jgi:Succinyl-CoA ligase like flavodoxin domain
MLDFATVVNVGLSYMVTLGNEAMITAGHVLDFLVDDPATRAVAIFMETVRDPDVFRGAARRAAEAGKAIVVLKAGGAAGVWRGSAWQRIDAAADAGHEGALALESWFIGQVVGSFTSIRPAADITRQIIADWEQRIAELGALL